MATRSSLRRLSTAARDRVFVRNMVFHAKHGVLPEERSLGQRFELDLEMRTDLRVGAATDALEDTVDYIPVVDIIKASVQRSEPCFLIETLAHEIALDALRSQPAAAEVTVTVRKPHVPVSTVQLDAVGIEVTRTRADLEGE